MCYCEVGLFKLNGKLSHQVWMGAADNSLGALRKLVEVWGMRVWVLCTPLSLVLVGTNFAFA